MRKIRPTAELAVIENTKLTELIQKSGVELTKAEAHVSAFHPALFELSELSRPLAGLDKVNPSSEHARIARENRLKIVKIRTGSESIKDERKKVLLAESNLIQSAFNLVKDACILTESEYEEIEKHQERIEAQKRAELKQSRIALLEPFETDTEYLPLDIMDEERFQALLIREKEGFEAVTAKRKQDEADRVAAEKKAEEDRLAEIEAENKRQIERDAENERLKKEAEIKEVRTKELMPLLIMIRDFEAMVNMPEKEYQKELAEIKIGYQQHLEYQAEQERKEKDRLEAENKAREKEMRRLELEAENAKKEREKLQAELEAKQLEEENERLAKIAEQEAKDAAAKAALLAPDKEKVRIFYDQFIALKFPELSSEPGIKMSARVAEALEVVKQLIISDSKNLL